MKIKKIMYPLKLCVLASLIMLVALFSYKNIYYGSVSARLETGESGEKVAQVQKALYELGIYGGQCDGVYDIETAEAVRRFQKHKGLAQTGICDERTLEKLGVAEYSFADIEKDTLARLIEAEAGGKDLRVMTAVGGVVMNRVKSEGFPDTVLEVIYSDGAFESVISGNYLTVYASDMAYRAAEDALMGIDPSNGALYVSHVSSNGGIVTLKSEDLFFSK